MASEIRVNKITHTAGVGTITTNVDGIVVAGIITANSFSGNVTGNITGNVTGAVTGSGANLTSIPAGELTGTVADARLSTVSSSKLSGALPSIDGSNLTGINAGVGTQGSVNTSGIITATALVGDFAPRNIIINGAMQINQRLSGTLTVNSSTGQYPCDRWVSRGEGGSKAFTIEKTSIASSGQGIRNALKVTSSQAASVGSSDIFNVRQMIEGYNIQRFNLGEAGCASMTLSFTVRSSVAGTHSGAIQNSAQDLSYPFTYTLAANTWTDVKITIPPITSGSFPEDNGVGLRVVFDMGSGNNFRGTANQWNSAQDEGATGAVRILETNGATWEITKVQLEEGTVATKFEKKLYGDELRGCRRYFQRFAGHSDHFFFGISRAESGTARTGINIPVPMRAAPTVACSNHRTFRDGTNSSSTGSPAIAYSSSWISEAAIYTIDFPGHSLTHNAIYLLMSNGTASQALTLDSEL